MSSGIIDSGSNGGALEGHGRLQRQYRGHLHPAARAPHALGI